VAVINVLFIFAESGEDSQTLAFYLKESWQCRLNRRNIYFVNNP